MSEDNDAPSDWASTFDPAQVEKPVVRTGFPPGNVSRTPGEVDQRLKDEATGGKEYAWAQAWARREARQNKAAPPAGIHEFPKASAAKLNPPKASAIKPKDIQGLAATVQLAHAMLAMTMKNDDWAISEH